jgi:hypothetical protein
MNRTAIVMAMVLCSVVLVNAETYTWTDDRGVVNFSDDPGRIPPRYREKAHKGDDITTRNPKVQQRLKEQDERARQEEIDRPRFVAPPEEEPPLPQPVVVEEPRPVTEGRTKSQRIQDNIERREAEERARQLEGKPNIRW